MPNNLLFTEPKNEIDQEKPVKSNESHEIPAQSDSEFIHQFNLIQE